MWIMITSNSVGKVFADKWLKARYFFFSIYCLIVSFLLSEDEPGKQVRSAIGIKNTCKSHVAFKVIKIFLSCFLMLFLSTRYLITHLRNQSTDFKRKELEMAVLFISWEIIESLNNKSFRVYQKLGWITLNSIECLKFLVCKKRFS